MKIYCSGIGGIGLSAYAALQAKRGHAVMGSDRKDSALLQDLRSQGVTVFLSQDGSHVPADADLFVYSEAIPADAPERVKAKEHGIEAWSYFHALGELSKDSFVIAVCGTHGKSSTTAMAARLLIEAGKDPTVIVGTKVRELDGRNWRHGKSELFVLEACEYRRSFHYLHPDIVLMTNAGGDHFDAYKDVADYQQAFVEFLRRLPADGKVITHLGDADCKKVAQESGKTTIDADAFPLVPLATPGMHMRQNAQLVLALAKELKIGDVEAAAILKDFAGTWRRMEVKGEWQGVTIVDDYAHHPNEIRATLAAMREKFPGRRIVCLFQPHTHDRTLKLYDEFLVSFKDADVVVVPNVYNARADIETATVDVPTFIGDIAAGSGSEVINGKSLTEAENMLRETILKEDDVLVCMGAGDVTEVAGRFVDEN
jgi:UDP-N-acetylmuramate--alanine ligase